MLAISGSLRERLDSFYADYAAAIDDDIERWPEFFTEDAQYRIVSRENYERGLPLATMRCEGRGMLMDRVVAIRKTSVYVPRIMRHIYGSVRVGERSDDRSVRVRTSFAVFESLAEGRSQLFAVGRTFDRVADDGETLRFAERIAVLDGDLIEGSLIYPI